MVVEILSKLPEVIGPIHRLTSNRPEMSRIFRAAIERALCPEGRNEDAVRDLAKKIESNMWTPEAAALLPGREEKFRKRIGKRWRSFWRQLEQRFVANEFWRVHVGAWVADSAADDEIRAMHELTPCPRGPMNTVELGRRFPRALDEELADNPDSKLANQLATRLQEADERYKNHWREALNRGAKIGGYSLLGAAVAKLGADLGQLPDLMDVLVTGVGTVGGVAAGVATTKPQKLRSQTREHVQRWIGDLRSCLDSPDPEAEDVRDKLEQDLHRRLIPSTVRGGDDELELVLQDVGEALAGTAIAPSRAAALKESLARLEATAKSKRS